MDILDFGYYYVLRPLAAVAFSLYKVEVIGKENAPSDKGFILAANHCSYLDGPFIAWLLLPRSIHWIVAKQIYLKWYFRPACVISRSVPVNGSVRLAEKLLDRGNIVGIFPYGGICCDRYIKKGRKGVAVLALRTGIPVVPCYIEGELTPGKRVHIAPKVFKPLKLIFGKPLYFEKCLSKRIPRDVLESTLVEVLRSINSLVPSKK